MLRRSSARIANTLRSAQVTRLISKHTANKEFGSFKIMTTNFNGIRAPMTRQFSSEASKLNYYQRMNRFENVVGCVTAGSALLGVAGGIVYAGMEVFPSGEDLFMKPFEFGVASIFFGFGGGIFGGISGAVCSVPIAFTVAFPAHAAGAAAVTGVSLLVYKNRDLLFSPKPTPELASSNTETSHSRLRFER